MIFHGLDMLLICVMIGTSMSSEVMATRQRYYYRIIYIVIALAKILLKIKTNISMIYYLLSINQLLELTFLSQTFLRLIKFIEKTQIFMRSNKRTSVSNDTNLMS
jgi:hypothetical protein